MQALKKTIIALLASLQGLALFSQTGGDHVYDFLNLTHSSLVASLGGTNVSLNTGDLNLAYHNPALLNADMDNMLALNYVNYMAGINYGMTMFSKSYNGIGNIAAGMTYLNYGSFRETDEAGNITGTFTAAEYALSLIFSKQVDSLVTVGVNVKPVLSNLEKYTSFGLAIDAGAAYHSRNNLFSAGVVIKNAGLEITTYAGEAREKLPFEIEAGVSQKLNHAPLRFSLTFRHLEKYDLTYTYKSADTSSTPGSGGVGENLMRHVILGAELIPSKNFYFSAGYNYQRRKELQVESKVSTVGFSWGFGINTSYLSIGFARATYHLAGTTNTISILVRPDQVYKKLTRKQ
ncbi:MAG TPA: type IX secretion system protein PorQ [Bacteroidales bacterium]|nr:type IX secretion system protein PorQ [Bacteroidales bacterium]